MALTRLDFYKKKIDDSKKDMKSMYKVLNKVLGTQKEKVYPTNKGAKSVADDFADFFSAKIQKIRNEISEKITHESSDPILPNKDVLLMRHFSLLEIEDVRILIKDMNSKSCALDPMPTWLLKECQDELLPILTHIVNISLSEQSFPNSLKHATITPTIKDSNEDSELYSNYRPISNTAFIAKLLEKAALKQISEHIDTQNLHAELQSAYRKFHSCETATLKVVNDLKVDIAKGNINALLLLDMSAAFDTVDHGILTRRLVDSYGIVDSVAKWLNSYVTNRTFTVHVNGKNSKEMNMLYGVPQGSLLGPIMFILYTKDIINIAKKYGLSIHLYADDTQLYIGFQPNVNIQDTKDRIENCLTDIKEWMLHNFLQLNPGKTKIIFIGSKRQLQTFNGLQISQVQTENYEPKVVKTLGVYLDSTLSMVREINLKCSASYYHLRNIGRIKRCLNEDQRILLVHNLVFSKLDYCNSMLANVPGYNIKKLQRVINAATRMIYDVKKRAHITPFAKKAHFLPAKFRIKYKLCLLVYKTLNGMAPSYMQDMLVSRVPTLRGNRDAGLLKFPPKPEKTIYYQMCISWNALPSNIRFSENTELFKQTLKTHYFNEAYNNISNDESDSNDDTDSDFE